MKQVSPYPLVKLPIKMQMSLCLIKEELKTRKLFRILQEIGMTECGFEPHLDSLILQTIGLDDEDDNVSNRYFSIMEKRSKKIEDNNDSMMKQTFKAYHEILNIKKEQASKKF